MRCAMPPRRERASATRDVPSDGKIFPLGPGLSPAAPTKVQLTPAGPDAAMPPVATASAVGSARPTLPTLPTMPASNNCPWPFNLLDDCWEVRSMRKRSSSISLKTCSVVLAAVLALALTAPTEGITVGGVDYLLYARCKIGLEQGGTDIDGNVRVAQICGA